jgi:hypothetical protein
LAFLRQRFEADHVAAAVSAGLPSMLALPQRRTYVCS